MGNVIEIFATVLGLTCVFLAGRGKVLNFWVGYLYNIVLFVLFLNNHLYSSMILQPISLAINFIGHYRWTHPKEGEIGRNSELKVSTMKWLQRVMTVFIVFIAAGIWGWIVQKGSMTFPNLFEPAAHPFLDSFVTIMILTAQYLSAQKKIECWAAWTVVNVAQIVLYLLAGMILMPFVSLAYLVLAFFGFRAWKKSMEC